MKFYLHNFDRFIVRRKRVILVILSLSSSSFSCLSYENFSNFKESDCDIRDSFVYIESRSKNQKNEERIERSFQFERKGIALRVYPVYYAIKYSDLISIHHAISDENPTIGFFSLKIKKHDNKYEYEPLGMISVECVGHLAEYFEHINVKVDILHHE